MAQVLLGVGQRIIDVTKNIDPPPTKNDNNAIQKKNLFEKLEQTIHCGNLKNKNKSFEMKIVNQRMIEKKKMNLMMSINIENQNIMRKVKERKRMNY